MVKGICLKDQIHLFNFCNCLSLPILLVIIALVKHKISQITDIFWGERGWKRFNVSFSRSQLTLHFRCLIDYQDSTQYIACNITTEADLSIIVPY